MPQHPKRWPGSHRYPGYNYADPGSVFVTICTHEKQQLFGSVQDGLMILNTQGQAVADLWQAISDACPGVELDVWIVMPDHLHGILHLGTTDELVVTSTLGNVVRWFKATSVEAWRRAASTGIWPRYDRHLWHPNFHDAIIRSDRELDERRSYIEGNPGRWWERRHG